MIKMNIFIRRTIAFGATCYATADSNPADAHPRIHGSRNGNRCTRRCCAYRYTCRTPDRHQLPRAHHRVAFAFAFAFASAVGDRAADTT